MKKIKVRYAKVVIMEAEVEVDDDKIIGEIYDGAGLGLPTVYDERRDGEGWPDHVVEVVDYDVIWKTEVISTNASDILTRHSVDKGWISATESCVLLDYIDECAGGSRIISLTDFDSYIADR